MYILKSCGAVLLALGLVAGWAPALNAQERAAVPTRERVAVRELLAITYPEGQTIGIKFRGTARLPRASGEAKVERKKGATKVEVELDEMKPATAFGGDFNTYVLWAVSPEGLVTNVGEIILGGNRSKLTATTPMDTFGLMVTAEPHALVRLPSRMVVVENSRLAERISGHLMKTAIVKFKGYEGVYESARDSLVNVPENKGELRTDRAQARAAVRLAERAGADQFAPEELARARAALQQVESAAGGDPKQFVARSHDAIRHAVVAERLTEERAAQAALAAERRAQALEAARLEGKAEQAQTEAERARRQTDQAQQQTAQARQQTAQAQQQTGRALSQAAEEERRRQQAEAGAREARLEAQQLAVAKGEAEQAAERARQERSEARAQLQQALSRVVQTRETVRGLIVSLPDILFETGKANLNPQAREVLSKISGILMVVGGYRLHVEGHTDNVGGDDLNQRLSDRRAQSVRDYLLQSGLSAHLITTRGFGESQPLASNATPAGRQENRRVEIVIEELGDFRFKP